MNHHKSIFFVIYFVMPCARLCAVQEKGGNVGAIPGQEPERTAQKQKPEGTVRIRLHP